MYSFRSLLSLGLLLVVLSPCLTLDCNLSKPRALSACVRHFLEKGRPIVRGYADPLRLRDYSGGGKFSWSLTNIRITGLSNYRIHRLSVRPTSRDIHISASFSWPSIVGRMNGRIKACKRIIFKLCARASGSPRITLVNPRASLTTTLHIKLGGGGRIYITPRGTRISVSLSKIRVKANLRGFLGALNRILGDPASRFASKVANNWWQKNRDKLQAKAREALHKVIREKVAQGLSKLLKGFGR